MNTNIDWTQAEAALGLRLPGDLKEIVRRYGTGSFCDGEFWVYPPERLVAENQALAEKWRPLFEKHPERSHPLYPDPKGLLIWGGDANGRILCWRMDGEPDEWEVVVWLARDGEFHQWDCGASDYLAEQLEITAEIWEEEIEPAVLRFRPEP